MYYYSVTESAISNLTTDSVLFEVSSYSIATYVSSRLYSINNTLFSVYNFIVVHAGYNLSYKQLVE